jgi:hypothetical protein
MCSPWFPVLTPSAGSALPFAGFPEASSPTATVLRRCATPWVPGVTLGCLRGTLPGVVPVVSLPAVQDTQPRAGGSAAGPHVRKESPGDLQGLPSSRETPIAHSPCSATPVGLHAPHQDGARARPPLRETRRLPHWDFRSSIARLLGSLSTLRGVSCPTATQDSLPGAG